MGRPRRRARRPRGRLRRADRRRLRAAVATTVTVGGRRPGRLCAAPRHEGEPADCRSAGSRAEVQVELRGAGSPPGEVRNFGTPAVLDADSIIACEVLTPAGNWCSYPPHKHDEERPGRRRELEEIYYFELSSTVPPDVSRRRPVGYQRVYGTAERPIDVLAEVRTGDVVLVPHGWHGPAIAPPGYDLYYLNVMAGPGPDAPGGSATTPAHAWVRDAWADAGRRPPTAHGRHPMKARRAATVRLTVAQALVRFLAQQCSERDGERQKLFAGCFGIFGHGNVAGIGQALLQDELGHRRRRRAGLPYVLARNEQAMVHTAVGYAKHRDRLADLGRARHPSAPARRTCSPARPSRRSTGSRCCSCPSARSRPGSAPRCCRSWSCRTPATSRSTTPSGRCPGSSTGVTGPSSCPPRCSAACGCSPTRSRPARSRSRCRRTCRPRRTTGRSSCSPSASGTWPRPPAEPSRVAGGGGCHPLRPAPAGRRRGRRHYSGAEDALARLPRPPASRSARPRPARARCCTATRSCSARSARPGPPPPTRSPATPTSSSASAPAGATSPPRRAPPSRPPESASSTSTSQGSTPASTPGSPSSPTPARPHRAHRGAGGLRGRAGVRAAIAALWQEWDAQVATAYDPPPEVTDRLAPGLLTQAPCSARSTSSPTRATSSSARPARCPVTCTSCGGCATARATTSSTATPAWATRSPAPSGSALADDTRDVFAMVGDGGYLMMPTELVDAVQERIKVVVVLVQNHGFHSIGSLSESLGSQRFGTELPLPRRPSRPARRRTSAGRPRGERPQPRRPRHRGARRDEPDSAIKTGQGRARATAARSSSTSRPTRWSTRPDSESWWDVPVSAGLRARQHAGRLRGLHRGQSASVVPRPAPGRGAASMSHPPARRRRRRRAHGHRPRRAARPPHRGVTARRRGRPRDRRAGRSRSASGRSSTRPAALVASPTSTPSSRLSRVRPRDQSRLPRARQAGAVREAPDDGRRVVAAARRGRGGARRRLVTGRVHAALRPGVRRGKAARPPARRAAAPAAPRAPQPHGPERRLPLEMFVRDTLSTRSTRRRFLFGEEVVEVTVLSPAPTIARRQRGGRPRSRSSGCPGAAS